MAGAPDPNDSLERLEGEVSDLLEEAEALASDLTKEVGEDTEHPSERESEFFESSTDSEASLDVAMEQATGAAQAASEEAGATPPPPAPPKKISLPSRSKATATDSSQPSAPQGGTAQQAPTPPSSKPHPFAALKQDATPQAGATDTFEDLSSDGAEGLVAAKIESPPFELEAPSINRAAALAQKLGLSRVAALKEPAIDHVYTALEVIDKPFAKIGNDLRNWLGIAAIILAVGTASLLFFVVL